MRWLPKTLQKRIKGGSRVRNDLVSGWRLAHGPEGWLVLSRPFPLSSGQHALEVHGQWVGPSKLIEFPGRTDQRVEFFLGRQFADQDEPEFDPDSAKDLATLTDELFALAKSGERSRPFARWMPPSASALAGWLSAAGRESVIDQEENLRLSLHRPGYDGQVRVEREEGRLRFVLPLGDWPTLDPACERAMRALAGMVNSQARLVRIVWLTSGPAHRCEAQVDLSGLPLPAPDSPWRESLWTRSTGMAVRALELAMRQLGLELSVLADERYRDLASFVER